MEVKNGDIDVQCASLPPDAEIMLRTVNGDVTLRLPPEASAQIGAETSVGAVRTQGLSLSKQNFAPQDAGGKYNAQLGEGEAAVDLQTKNGDILIAAPDTGPVESSADEPAQEAEGGGVPGLSVPPSDTTITPEEGPDTTEMPSTRADTAAATRADTAAADTSQVSEE